MESRPFSDRRIAQLQWVLGQLTPAHKRGYLFCQEDGRRGLISSHPDEIPSYTTEGDDPFDNTWQGATTGTSYELVTVPDGALPSYAVATAGQLQSGPVTNSVAAVQGLINGGLIIPVEGVSRGVGPVDFTDVASEDDIAIRLTAHLNGCAVCVWDGLHYVITGNKVGVSSVGYAVPPSGMQVDISGMLCLTLATGGLVTAPNVPSGVTPAPGGNGLQRWTAGNPVLQMGLDTGTASGLLTAYRIRGGVARGSHEISVYAKVLGIGGIALGVPGNLSVVGEQRSVVGGSCWALELAVQAGATTVMLKQGLMPDAPALYTGQAVSGSGQWGRYLLQLNYGDNGITLKARQAAEAPPTGYTWNRIVGIPDLILDPLQAPISGFTTIYANLVTGTSIQFSRLKISGEITDLS